MPVQDEISPKQRAALLTLLTDEDPEVQHHVREKILSAGPGTIQWLRPHTLSNDPILRARTQSIIRQFERHAADNEFVAFCLRTGEDLSLEQGVWLLARTEYPEVNIDGYNALLDTFARELETRIQGILNPRQLLRAMRIYLHDELQFTGDTTDYYDPQNSYFNKVIDRRLGNPISLCTLYLLLARRLQLPITGIGLPGHFLCRMQTTSVELFIDAFNDGKILNKARCVQYLVQNQFGVRDDYLAPLSPRRMLLRMCGNLHQVYGQRQQEAESLRIRRYMVALSG